MKAEGLGCALRSTGPDGVCTSTGIYLRDTFPGRTSPRFTHRLTHPPAPRNRPEGASNHPCRVMFVHRESVLLSLTPSKLA